MGRSMITSWEKETRAVLTTHYQAAHHCYALPGKNGYSGNKKFFVVDDNVGSYFCGRFH